jgi:arylsulfatase
LLAAAVTLGPGVVSAARARERRPNVVLIVADDLGFSDIGCYGSEILTPELDRLAAGGLRFRQFYNTGRCWPTRASLLTGLYPHQAHMAMNFGDDAPPAYSGNIPFRCRMIPELLKPLGYRSYHVGKWHLNNRARGSNQTWPLGRGFDRSYFLAREDNYFFPRLVFDDNRKIDEFPSDYYATDALNDCAVAYLKEHGARHKTAPFFLYLAYTAPHFPLHARAEDVARYRGAYRVGWHHVRQQRYRRLVELGVVNCPLSPRDPSAAAWDDLGDAEKVEWDARMATYAGMITCMDRGLGRVVRQLEAMGALEDTLIMFLSDNGSSAEYIVRGDGHQPGAPPGSRQSYRCLEVGWSNAANTPFRQHKMWTHEGGIATPLVVHWPYGVSTRGTWIDDVGHVIDVLPTILEVCGATYPARFEGEATPTLPGISLAPLFRGRRRAAHEFLFWEHVGNKAIRRGDWKLVAEHGGPWELYNLHQDRSETQNLARQRPELVKELDRQWQAFARQIGVVEWDLLPQSKVSPAPDYRRK